MCIHRVCLKLGYTFDTLQSTPVVTQAPCSCNVIAARRAHRGKGRIGKGDVFLQRANRRKQARWHLAECCCRVVIDVKLTAGGVEATSLCEICNYRISRQSLSLIFSPVDEEKTIPTFQAFRRRLEKTASSIVPSNLSKRFPPPFEISR